MEWHFGPNLFHSGYSWIFPHKDRASIGAYAERKNLSPRRLTNALHKWASQRGICFGASKPVKGQGAVCTWAGAPRWDNHGNMYANWSIWPKVIKFEAIKE